jgi:hypothetical protein
VNEFGGHRCSNCGRDISPGRGRCATCGTPFKTPPDRSGRRGSPGAGRRPPPRVLFPTLLLSLLLLALLLLLWTGTSILPGKTRGLPDATSSTKRGPLGSLEPSGGPVLVPAGAVESPRFSPALETVPPAGGDQKAYALNREGVRLFKEGDVEAAREKLHDAHLRLPGQPIIARNLSSVLTYLGWQSVKGEAFDQALSYFDQALRADEENVQAWKGSGYARIQLEETDAAIRDFEEAHRLAPGDADVALALARLLYQSDELDRAKRVLDALLAEQPGQEKAKKLLARMTQDDSVERSFQANDTGHFRLKFDAMVNGDMGSLVGAILEEAYTTIGGKFHHYPPDPVVVILYTKEEFRSVSDTPHWSRGIYDGKIRIPIGGVNERTEELEDVVFHEYTHVVVNQMTRGRAPTWLNEGLAQYSEPSSRGGKRALLEAVRRYGLVPLSDLEGSFLKLSGTQARLAYAEAYAAVLYIGEVYSFYHLRSILEHIGAGDTPEEAVKKVLHFGYADLVAGIADYVSRTG